MKTKISIMLPVLAIIVFASLTSTVDAASGDLVWAIQNKYSAGWDAPLDIAVNTYGVFVAGYDSTYGSTNQRWRIERRSLTTGGLVWQRTYNPSGGNDRACGIATDSTSAYIVGYSGFYAGSENTVWIIQKRTLATGALLWNYVYNPSTGSDAANDVAIDYTGVYVVGYDSISPGNTRWRIVKMSLNGRLAWSVTYNGGSGQDIATGIAIDSTGIYVVGYFTEGFLFANKAWRITKLSKSNGAAIWSQSYNPSTGFYGEDVPTGVAVNSYGLFVVGYDSLGAANTRWRMQKRSSSTGALLVNRTFNPSSYHDRAEGVAVDNTGVYIVGYDCIAGSSNARWRMQKRSLSTLSLIWDRASQRSTADDVALGVGVYGTGVYIAGVTNSTSAITQNIGWRIERRQA